MYGMAMTATGEGSCHLHPQILIVHLRWHLASESHHPPRVRRPVSESFMVLFKTSLLPAVLLLASAFNAVYLLWYHISHVHWPRSRSPSYSWQGHDHPENLIPPHELSTSPVEHVVTYDSSIPLAGRLSDQQWFELTSLSAGYVRLGPQNRLFMVTMFHEVHCLRLINLAFDQFGYDEHETAITHGHVKHCFDYLRQMILCSADLTLEKGDFEEEKNSAATHICRNWHMVYKLTDENWHKWNNGTDVPRQT